jgi:hypothetical protein
MALFLFDLKNKFSVLKMNSRENHSYCLEAVFGESFHYLYQDTHDQWDMKMGLLSSGKVEVASLVIGAFIFYWLMIFLWIGFIERYYLLKK